MWHHVLVKRSNSEVAMYVNGIKLPGLGYHSAKFDPGVIRIGNGPLGDDNGNDNPIYMDDVRIYNRSLDENQIHAISFDLH
jgi:hypothetical protein